MPTRTLTKRDYAPSYNMDKKSEGGAKKDIAEAFVTAAQDMQNPPEQNAKEKSRLTKTEEPREQ